MQNLIVVNYGIYFDEKKNNMKYLMEIVSKERLNV